MQVSSEDVFNYVTNSGRLEEAFQIDADGIRIDKLISSCARAIHLHETGRKFLGPIKTIAAFMSYLNKDFDQAVSEAMFYAKEFLKSASAKGENQEVFYYKFAEGEGTAVLLMCFYGGSEFLVRLDKRQSVELTD